MALLKSFVRISQFGSTFLDSFLKLVVSFLQCLFGPLAFRDVQINSENALDLACVEDGSNHVVVVTFRTLDRQRHLFFDLLASKSTAIVFPPDDQILLVSRCIFGELSGRISPMCLGGGILQHVAAIHADGKDIEGQIINGRPKDGSACPQFLFRSLLVIDVGHAAKPVKDLPSLSFIGRPMPGANGSRRPMPAAPGIPPGKALHWLQPLAYIR